MCRLRLSVIILCISLHHAYQYQIADFETSEPDNHFDKIIFTQEWPVSYCKKWKHMKPGAECVFPKHKNMWTVHGIWPWVHGDEFPDYCNNSWPLDPDQIRSIEDDLREAWTNIFKGSKRYWLWDHEWRRHGTCTAVLEPLNTQLKFFSKGIEWNQKYSLSDMLAAANMFPDDTKELDAEEFFNAVKAKTKKVPTVICKKLDRNNKNELPFIWELRICLDKQFNLIDCNPVVSNSCTGSKIIFPANV